jgi:hypothetical protein
MQHTLRKQRQGQREQTLAMFAILAVFQAPMFALNAVAPLNACKPSHARSMSPRSMSPELRWSI